MPTPSPSRRVRPLALLPSDPQAWAGLIPFLTVGLAAFLLAWLHDSLELSHQILLWAGYFAAVGWALRKGWLRFFGPVLFYDLLTVGRRERYWFLRWLFALFLFLL